MEYDAQRALDAVANVKPLIAKRDEIQREIDIALVKCYDLGASYQEISKWVGLARQTVMKRVKDFKRENSGI